MNVVIDQEDLTEMLARLGASEDLRCDAVFDRMVLDFGHAVELSGGDAELFHHQVESRIQELLN